jgi:branched-chain amino acid aminotransferase
MAMFEGVKWASRQMRYQLASRTVDFLDSDAGVFAVSRSIHYGLFLVFEGIRFFCRKTASGRLQLVFLNWDGNLERFRRGMAFSLGRDQQGLVPKADELENLLGRIYFREPALKEFLEEMAGLGAQGYLRPFTLDEEQSIGVTYPAQPSIRAVACRYDRYLGEPFCGVVVPGLVRAVGANKTGCLKLGVNYVMSVRAVDQARAVCPDAASALFLDDNPAGRLEDRRVTEWDSSCCLFGFRDGSVLKIPEHDLILPSVTIQGITAILKKMNVPVQERHLTYGELLEEAASGRLVVACSVGTAGILSRCQKLVLVDGKNAPLTDHHPDESHPLFRLLGEAREYYWNIYKGRAEVPSGLRLFTYDL